MIKDCLYKFQISITLMFLFSFVKIDAQQININRIEQMPNHPQSL